MKTQITYILCLFICLCLVLTDGLEVKINEEEVPFPGQKLKSRLKKYVPSKLLEQNDGGHTHLVIPIKDGYSIEESILNKDKNYKQAKFVTGESRIYSSLTKMRNHVSNRLFNSKSTIDDNHTEGDEDIKDEFESIEPTSSLSSFVMITPATSTVSNEPSMSAKLSSKKSWVKEFLKFKHNNSNLQQDLIFQQQSLPAIRKLKSNIHNYHDTISSQNPDLKKWTKLIIEQDNLETIGQLNTKFNDYSYKQYGINQPNPNSKDQYQDNNQYYYSNGHYYLSNKKEIELDVEEFIKYLINYEGFKREDLEFLKSTNLDYGLKEIERELNKIKDLERKNNINIIDIGGEPPQDKIDNDNKNVPNLAINFDQNRRQYCSYIYLILLLLIML